MCVCVVVVAVVAVVVVVVVVVVGGWWLVVGGGRLRRARHRLLKQMAALIYDAGFPEQIEPTRRTINGPTSRPTATHTRSIAQRKKTSKKNKQNKSNKTHQQAPSRQRESRWNKNVSENN